MENKEQFTNQSLYFNRAQQQIFLTMANTVFLVAGRRFGKSHGVLAPRLLQNVQRMPRSTGAVVMSSYKQGLLNTLPGTLNALGTMGYKRDVHYYINRRPPKKLKWPEPYIMPQTFDHIIYFYNGTVVYMISQDRPATSNSLTLDWLIGDEARFLNYEKLSKETFPANGGFKGHFANCPLHHGMMFVSDMPTTKKGSWFLSYKDKATPQIVAMIGGTLNEIYQKTAEYRHIIEHGGVPKPYLRGYILKLHKDLAILRSQCTDYRQLSSLENMELLGEAYIRQMKRDLPPLTFQTSIMSISVGSLPNGFYSSLTENHKYIDNDNSYLDSLDYKFDKISAPSSLMDADCHRDQPICIGMDYNSNINWIVAGQPRGDKIFVIKSFYVKFKRKLEALVDDFCNYYRHHGNKKVIYYYDSTAKNNNYAVDDKDFKTVISNRFQANHWYVDAIDIGAPMAHMQKYFLINRMLDGLESHMPLFNEENNRDLLLAMGATGVLNGHKDKSGEKLPEYEENKLEHRTDGTDAFDTLSIGCEKFATTSIYYAL